MVSYHSTFEEVQAEATAGRWKEDRDRYGRLICWVTPGRATVPHKHIERPAPTPGCGCLPCARPMCCGQFAVPVVLSSGATVNYLCAVCLGVPEGTSEALGAHLRADRKLVGD